MTAVRLAVCRGIPNVCVHQIIQLMSLVPVNTHLGRGFLCDRRNAVEVWCKTLFPAGLVEAASLVSRGGLPVLACQPSGHQDCKSTLLRRWQRHLLNSLLHCTLSFFTCASHSHTACSTTLLCGDFVSVAVIVVPLCEKGVERCAHLSLHTLLVLRGCGAHTVPVAQCGCHSWVCQKKKKISSWYSLIREIKNITVTREGLCASVPTCQSFEVWYFLIL